MLSLARKLRALQNSFPTEKTPRDEIAALMRQLHPINCDKKLIRLGPDGDGGYLVPDDLEGVEACFSPGVSSISGFEADCAKRDMKVFLADKSVESPAEQHELFQFIPKFIGVTSNDDFTTLDDWVQDSLPASSSDLILQMDIEGYEYEVFLAASPALMNRFRILVVEFHFFHQYWNAPYFNLVSRAFAKILQTHACLHIHPNNCCGSTEEEPGLVTPRLMELTFLRRDRVSDASEATQFPHPLDFDNTENVTMVLPKCWYKSS